MRQTVIACAVAAVLLVTAYGATPVRAQTSILPSLNLAFFVHIACTDSVVLDPNVTLANSAQGGSNYVQQEVINGAKNWRDSVNTAGGLTLFGNQTMFVNVTFFCVGPASDTNTAVTRLNAITAVANPYGTFQVLITNPTSSATLNAKLMLVCENTRACVFINPLAATTSLFECGGSSTPMPADCTSRNRRQGARRFDYSFSAFPREGQTMTPFLNLMVNKGLKKLVVISSTTDSYNPASTSVSVATAQSSGLDVQLVYYLTNATNALWTQQQWDMLLLNISTNYAPDGLAMPLGSAAQSINFCAFVMRAMKNINWFPKAAYIGSCASGASAIPDIAAGQMLKYWFNTQPWDERLRGQQFRVFSYPGSVEPFEATATEDSPQVFARLERARYGLSQTAPMLGAALGAFACLMAQKALEVNPSLNPTADNVRDGIRQLSQASHLGTMQFDQWGRLVPLVFTFTQYGDNAQLILMSPIPGGSDPIVPTPTWEEREYTRTDLYHTTAEWIVVALTILSIIYVLVLLAVTVYHRKNGVILAATPVFCVFTLLGGITLMSTNFVWTTHENDYTCPAKLWLLQLGFTLLFSSMLIKTVRIWAIFKIQKLQVVRIKTSFLVLSLTGVLLAETIFTLIWQFVAPFEPVIVVTDPLRPSLWYTGCTGGDTANDWIIAALIIKFALMGVSAVAAYAVRRVPSEFQESTFIGASIWNVTFLMVIGVSVVITSSDRLFSFYVRTLGILLLTVSTVSFVFIPKFIKLREGEGTVQSFYRDKNDRQAQMGTKIADNDSAQPGNSNTNHVQREHHKRLVKAEALLQRIKAAYPQVANNPDFQNDFVALTEPSGMGQNVQISVQQAGPAGSAKNRSVNDSGTHPGMGGRAPSNMGLGELHTRVGNGEAGATPSSRHHNAGNNGEREHTPNRTGYRLANVAGGGSGVRATNTADGGPGSARGNDRPSLMVGQSAATNPSPAGGPVNGNSTTATSTNVELIALPGQAPRSAIGAGEP